MITACHTLIYSDDAAATRAFFRDVLQLPHVEDAGSGTGWLIFRTGPSELGVHPTRSEHEGHVYESPRQHVVSLQCDDVEATKAELEGRGAQFTSDIVDEGYGLVTTVAVPGADDLMIYQPKHELALDA
jgi:catechol 2,3-dioxygenase-like lactoylglutathione lyase family enzyme